MPEDTPKTTGTGVVDQNVEAMMALHDADHRAMSRHHRAVDRLVTKLTVPATSWAMLLAILVWIGVNLWMRATGGHAWDNPPFGWLQTTVSVFSLLMTSLIFITQSRLGRIAERNAHLDLQVNLLVDQKTAKIIQLLEEMRKDSPTLRNRRDPAAEELQIAVDPSQVASAITEMMETTRIEIMDPPAEE